MANKRCPAKARDRRLSDCWTERAWVIFQPRTTDTEDDMTSLPTTPLADSGKPACADRPRLARVIQWAVEARSHRVICMLMGIWLLNAFDLTFTLLSSEQGVLHEENPLARHMLQNGIVSVILFKIGLVLIGSYPLLRFRRARITELGTCLILAAYAVLAFRWSNCYHLYSATALGGTDFAELRQLVAITTP